MCVCVCVCVCVYVCVCVHRAAQIFCAVPYYVPFVNYVSRTKSIIIQSD